ncbi:hypothetical protein ABH991_002918 [Bradyrhizobium ottawaense]|uniref:Uncharacterized protein n=1 Tax=Bradyrhizobium ottawaense TaxID=931866 RepID=A0ABV4FM53_9BRAD
MPLSNEASADLQRRSCQRTSLIKSHNGKSMQPFRTDGNMELWRGIKPCWLGARRAGGAALVLQKPLGRAVSFRSSEFCVLASPSIIPNEGFLFHRRPASAGRLHHSTRSVHDRCEARRHSVKLGSKTSAYCARVENEPAQIALAGPVPAAALATRAPVCNRTEPGDPDDVPGLPEGFVADKGEARGMTAPNERIVSRGVV